MGFDNVCHTGLDLGLGISSTVEITPNKPKIVDQMPKNQINFQPPSLTLALSGERYNDDGHSPASYSNASVKRERELGSEEAEAETERVISSRILISDEDDEGINGRKKLRLTKAQSALLEESFKQHSTLNPKQKQELARELNLRPRQVEVWFQNRRARTKLKQTEVDCEYLKKCCEKLREENKRLEKELQQLKSIKQEEAAAGGGQPLYMQLPAATLNICPSCDKILGTQNNNMVPNKPHFFTTTSTC